MSFRISKRMAGRLAKAAATEFNDAVKTEFIKVLANYTVVCKQWKFKDDTTDCSIKVIPNDKMKEQYPELYYVDMHWGHDKDEANEAYKELVAKYKEA